MALETLDHREFGRFLAAAGAAAHAPPLSHSASRRPRRDLGRAAQLVVVAYTDPAYVDEVDNDGHVAAWEEPERFSTEVRAAFRSPR